MNQNPLGGSLAQSTEALFALAELLLGLSTLDEVPLELELLGLQQLERISELLEEMKKRLLTIPRESQKRAYQERAGQKPDQSKGQGDQAAPAKPKPKAKPSKLDSAKTAMRGRHFDDAVGLLNEVIAAKADADGEAMYLKALAQYYANKHADAVKSADALIAARKRAKLSWRGS